MSDTITLPRNQFLSASTSSPSPRFFRVQECATAKPMSQEMERTLAKIQKIFDDLVTDLEAYETRFEMNSEQFYNQFQSGEIDDEREEFYDWRAKFSAYQNMNRRFGLSR